MRYLKTFLVVILMLILEYKLTFAQGCSDAGVCTLNSIKNQSLNFTEQYKRKNTFTAGISYGLAEYDIKNTSPYIEYRNNLTNKLSISGKFTYAFINGELGNTNDLGDVIITVNRSIYHGDQSLLMITVGGKIPLNNSNIKEDDEALPMHYQTSLGTYDFILGLNYNYMDLGLSVALQQPIINANKNEFISPTDIALVESKYHSTNSFERKGDLIARISYNIDIIENRLMIRPGILPIYHLGNDTYIDQNNNELTIDGSKGLTLNANIFINYYFANNKQVELAFGMPFITRDSRPDGLTREYVISIGYGYSF